MPKEEKHEKQEKKALREPDPFTAYMRGWSMPHGGERPTISDYTPEELTAHVLGIADGTNRGKVETRASLAERIATHLEHTKAP